VRADVLILLSDVDALYTKPPQEVGAEKIDYVTFGDDLDSVEFGDIGDAGVGTGGAVTKVAAAHLASASGTAVLITAAELVADALSGARIGTWFEPNPDRAA